MAAIWLAAAHAGAADYAIDCRKPPAGSMEVLVCRDADLMVLDRVMATVYAAALEKAGNERPPVLRAEQRGWIKGRNECWKSGDKPGCVAESYRRRIVELQARYRLVTASAAVRYVCNGNPADEVVATYFQTDPPALIAERGDQTSLMFQERSASGAKYAGRNEMLWEHQGAATIRWGYGTPEMRCVKVESGSKPSLLAGTTWRLRSLQSMDDSQGTAVVPEAQSYSVRFDAEGRASFQLDCNQGTASWQAAPAAQDSGTLNFGPLATTRALCPAGSLEQKLVGQLPHVRSYLFKGGRLYMSLMADGGILEWVKQQ